jgi:hypothetical protein
VDGNVEGEAAVPSVGRTSAALVTDFNRCRDKHEVVHHWARSGEAIGLQALDVEADVLADDAGVPALLNGAARFADVNSEGNCF